MRSFGVVRLGFAIAGILLAGSMLAQMPGNGMGPGFGEHRPPMERAFGVLGRWWNNPRIVERMKLTDEQRKEFDDIFLAHREKLIDLRASLQKAELALEPLMREDPPKEAKILAQIDKVAQARAELEKANGSFLLAIRSKLTTEQWKQLQADRASEGQGPGGWRQGGPYRRLAPPPAAEPPAPPAPPPGAEQ